MGRGIAAEISNHLEIRVRDFSRVASQRRPAPPANLYFVSARVEFIRLANPTQATCETAQRGTRTIIRADMITSAVSIRTSYPPHPLCTPLVKRLKGSRVLAAATWQGLCARTCATTTIAHVHTGNGVHTERRDDWETYN